MPMANDGRAMLPDSPMPWEGSNRGYKSMMMMIRIFKNFVKTICLEASPKIDYNQCTIPSSSRR